MKADKSHNYSASPKPSHLSRRDAEQFQDESVVEAYPLRPAYPAEVFDILLGLLDRECRYVLDVGCGTGEIARRLAPLVERIDAVDFSPAMIRKGKHLPGGDLHNLRWICSAVEDAALSPPYGLVTAAASLHWMDWDVVLPRFRETLSPNDCLAIIEDKVQPTPCPEALWPLVRRCSTNQEYQPYDLIVELEKRGLFLKKGEHLTDHTLFQQPVEDYVESFHARNGFSRDHMSRENAEAFDGQAREMLLRAFPDGIAQLTVEARVVWGMPARPANHK